MSKKSHSARNIRKDILRRMRRRYEYLLANDKTEGIYKDDYEFLSEFFEEPVDDEDESQTFNNERNE
jgi:hypothetical protein